MTITHTVRVALVASITSLLSVGCSAGIPEGRFACAADTDCPPGQMCGTDGLCRTNAGTTDTGMPGIDSAVDAGTSADGATPNDTGSTDTGSTDGGGNDAGNDAAPQCVHDADCDDGMFCNGAEACTSGMCTTGAAPCTGTEACHEATHTCTMATCMTDVDGDTYVAASCGGPDCNDSNAMIHPGAAEVCDNVDNDCNGTVDDATSTALCPALPGTASTCAAGVCGYACSSAFITCDTSNPGDSTGCEINAHNDVNHCGTCTNVCPQTMHQSSTCNGTCVVACESGYMDCNSSSTDGCETHATTCDLDPPRLIGPGDEMVVTSNTPVFRFVLGAGSTAAHVEVCTDETCGTVVISMTGTSPLTATSPLMPGHYFWRARAASGSFVATRASTAWGINTYSHSSVPSADAFPYLDVDHGIPDVMFGSPSTGSGMVRLYLNGATASPVMLPGPTAFGSATAAAGDVNGDGLGDLVVGACIGIFENTTAPTAAMCDGNVRVFLSAGDGTFGTPILLPAPAGVIAFGNAVSAAGDFDGDGYADIIVGAYYAGRAYVYRGGPSGTINAPVVLLPGGVDLGDGAAGGMFGAAVSFAGDVNGDGFDDVLVGQPTLGRVYLYLGNPGAVPTQVGPINTGGAGSDYGSSVSGIGDWNGDGYADFAVGALGPGTVEVRTGGPGISATLLPAVAYLSPGDINDGLSVAGLGDCDGDGRADVIAGDSAETPPQVVIIHGGSGTTTMFTDGSTNFGRVVGRLAGPSFVVSSCSATGMCQGQVTEVICNAGGGMRGRLWVDSATPNFGAGLMR